MRCEWDFSYHRFACAVATSRLAIGRHEILNYKSYTTSRHTYWKTSEFYSPSPRHIRLFIVGKLHSCPHAGCFLCGKKCSSGRKGSGDRRREEVCQVQRFVIQPYFYSGGCRVSWPIGGRRSSFYYRDWQKNDFQQRGSARNSVPVPTHLSGDSTLQHRVSCKHFHFRSVVVIPDIIIFIVIIVIIIIIIISGL